MSDIFKLSDPTFAYTKRPDFGRYLVARHYVGVDDVGFVLKNSPAKWQAVTFDGPHRTLSVHRCIGIYKTLKAAVKAIEDYYRKED